MSLINGKYNITLHLSSGRQIIIQQANQVELFADAQGMQGICNRIYHGLIEVIIETSEGAVIVPRAKIEDVVVTPYDPTEVSISTKTTTYI